MRYNPRRPEEEVPMLSRIFRSKDYGFYELFERHASTTLEEAKLLQHLLKNMNEQSFLVPKIEELEHQCDSITHMTIDLLHKCFVTPLDRNEIINLISSLDDVADAVQLVAKRISLFEVKHAPETLVRMGDVLVNGAERMKTMVSMVRGLKDEDKVRELAEQVHELENQGDQLFSQGVSEILKSSSLDILTVIKLKEIYEIIEQSIDMVEDVCNVVEGIFLEHA